MNHSYRIVFNQALGQPQAVGEHAASRGKQGGLARQVRRAALGAAAAALLAFAPGAWADSGSGGTGSSGTGGQGGNGGDGNGHGGAGGSLGAFVGAAGPEGDAGLAVTADTTLTTNASGTTGIDNQSFILTGGGGGDAAVSVTGSGLVVVVEGLVVGGTGGDGGGGVADAGGGGGGGGGAGVDQASGGTLSNNSSIAGGAGDMGGKNVSGPKGGGGGGGTGVAMAQNGTLNNTAVIAGGAGGSAAIGPGFAGDGGFGGGGGAGGTGVAMATGGTFRNSGGSVSGGTGGAGGDVVGDGVGPGPRLGIGGIGGQGGTGAALAQSHAQSLNTGRIDGGSGGGGGIGFEVGLGLGDFGVGGVGGLGGTGVALQGGFLTNSGAIGGGSGGSGGSGADVGALVSGGGGNGGTAADLAQGATLTNSGRISGGYGGGAGLGPGGVGNSNAAVGAGGVGVRMTGDGNRLVNSGIVGGGRSGDGATLANAVQITGSNNTVELRAGYGFEGNVVAGGGSGNTLALGGATNAGFDTGDIGAAASFLYQGFDSYRKIGSSTWTLTGASNAVTPWTLSAGVLSVSANGSLGDVAGTLAFDGGTLQTTADFTLRRAIAVDAAGGTFDTAAGTTLTQQGAITGTGGLVKTGAGTLTLSDTVAGTHTYSGGTTLQAGTLMAGMNGAFGTGDIAIQGGALGSTNGAILGNRLVVQSNFDLRPASSVDDVSFAGLRLNGDILLSTATGTDVHIRGVVSPLAGQPTSISHVELGGTIGGNHGLVLDAVDGNAAGGEFVYDMIGSRTNTYTGPTTVQGPTLLVLQRTLAAGAAAVPGNLTVQGTASVLLTGSEQIADGATVRVDSTGHTTQGFVSLGIPAIALAGLSLYSGTETIGRLEGSGSIALGAGTLRVGEGAFSGTIGDGDLVAATGGTPGGNLVKQGPGTLTLSGASSYTGSTTVSGGTLRAGAANIFSPKSLHAVQNGGTLDLAGFSQRIAGMALSAGGTVRLSDPATPAPGTTLTVTGPWTGQGGTLQLATTLGGSSSATDRLLLSGPQAIASGSTNVQVVNVNGLGALTTGNGIEVVATEGGGRIDGNAFALAGGHVDAGAYEYRLATTADGGYLRSTAAPPPPPPPPPPPASPPASPPPTPSAPSPAVVPLYRAEVPLFAALPAQLRQSDLAMLGNLQRRVGDLGMNTPGTGDRASRQAWARLVSSDIDIAQQGTVSPVSKGHVNGFQAGTDLLAASDWRAGLYVGQLDGDARVSGFARGVVGQVGSTDLRSQYLGAYATWAPESGFYADIALQAARHDFSAYPSLNTPAGGKGRSLLASVEVGQSFPLAAGWTMEPQLQLVHQRLDLDDVRIAGATTVRQDADNGWLVRAGLRVKGELATGMGSLQPYGRVNIYRRSAGTDIASFIGPAATTGIASRTGGTSAELAAGASLQVSAVWSAYGEIGKLWSTGGEQRTASSVQGSLGMRAKW